MLWPALLPAAPAAPTIHRPPFLEGAPLVQPQRAQQDPSLTRLAALHGRVLGLAVVRSCCGAALTSAPQPRLLPQAARGGTRDADPRRHHVDASTHGKSCPTCRRHRRERRVDAARCPATSLRLGAHRARGHRAPLRSALPQRPGISRDGDSPVSPTSASTRRTALAPCASECGRRH